MEPNRAASEIASQYTCETEIRTAGEVQSNPGVPSGTLEDSRSGFGYRCVARAALSSLLFHLAAASTAWCNPYRYLEVTDTSRGHRFRPDAGCGQYIPSERAPPVPSTSGETCP